MKSQRSIKNPTPTEVKANINNLPDKCFVVLEVERAIGRVTIGSHGYSPEDTEYHVDTVGKLYGVKRRNGVDYTQFNNEIEFLAKIVDTMNREAFGVSNSEMKAMKWGSMFGWDTPGANPALWQ